MYNFDYIVSNSEKKGGIEQLSKDPELFSMFSLLYIQTDNVY